MEQNNNGEIIVNDEKQMEIDSLKNQIQFLQNQNETLTVSLEIANERWIKSVNENMQLEIQLRKGK